MKNQKELKAAYIAELQKVWHGSQKMVDYCAKQLSYVIEHNGRLFEIEKPRIETRFCFGAGMYASCTDEEMNNAENMSETARSSADYFMAENLSGINRTLESLAKIREEMSWNWAEGSAPHYMVAINDAHYCGQDANCKLSGWSIVESWDYRQDGAHLCWDIDFIDDLITGYEQVKADFTKRLEKYLKRYGLSKVDAWTYIRD